MPKYTAKTLSRADSERLRRVDPAIVAAGFVSAAAGNSRFTAPLLFRFEALDVAHIERLRSETEVSAGYAIGSDGRVSRLAEKQHAEIEMVVGRPAFVPAVISLPVPELGDNGELHSGGGDWPPEWSLLNTPGTRAEAAPELGPALDFSVPAIRAAQSDLPAPPTLDGSGVIIGVVDWGCDFAHPAFRRPDGRTRIRMLWDQNGVAASSGMKLGAQPSVSSLPGRVFSASDLDQALRSPDPYWATGYDPTAYPYVPFGDETPKVVHGTHVLGTAGGGVSCWNGVSYDWPGVAPGADLMFVHLRPNALDASVRQTNGSDVIQGVASIFYVAQSLGRPCVVNLSMGNNTGPHDGSSVLEQMLDVLAAPPGRAIVVPAGNNREAHLHSSGSVWPGGPRTISWEFMADDSNANTVDLWYETPTEPPSLTISLNPPEGPSLDQPFPGQGLILLRDGKTMGTVLSESRPPEGDRTSWLQHLRIEISPTGNAESWQITLSMDPTVDTPTHFHAWIDRSDVFSSSQSHFAATDADRAYTLDSLSCGRNTLCVGAYYEIPRSQGATGFSSQGPTRDGRPKPDFSAPGYQVQAPLAKGGQRIKAGAPARWPLRAPMSGTSVSAPHGAGLVALLLQASPGATSENLRTWIASNTQLIPPTRAAQFHPGTGISRAWDPQLGFGRIDAAASVNGIEA
jgi:subtilisin family serine protease